MKGVRRGRGTGRAISEKNHGRAKTNLKRNFPLSTKSTSTKLPLALDLEFYSMVGRGRHKLANVHPLQADDRERVHCHISSFRGPQKEQGGAIERRARRTERTRAAVGGRREGSVGCRNPPPRDPRDARTDSGRSCWKLRTNSCPPAGPLLGVHLVFFGTLVGPVPILRGMAVLVFKRAN